MEWKEAKDKLLEELYNIRKNYVGGIDRLKSQIEGLDVAIKVIESKK